MNLGKYITFGVVLAAAPLFAQTAAEQLQRAIHTQDAQGKGEEAINLYRQLAYSTTTPVEVAAQAQYRLAQALLQKGELSAATREMERLERSFPDQSALIARLAASRSPALPAIAPTPYLAVEQFDLGRSITVRGPVSSMTWVNPTSWLGVTDGKEWRVQMTSPNQLVQAGLTRTSFKVGDIVTVTGAPARDGSSTVYAITVTRSDGTVDFDRAKHTAPRPYPMIESEKKVEQK